MLDSTNIVELQDYSEVSSTVHRDGDRINQLMREKKWLQADEEIVKFCKAWLRVAQWCRDQHDAEPARTNIGQELMGHLNGGLRDVG
jgi:hypothetical protein